MHQPLLFSIPPVKTAIASVLPVIFGLGAWRAIALMQFIQHRIGLVISGIHQRES